MHCLVRWLKLLKLVALRVGTDARPVLIHVPSNSYEIDGLSFATAADLEIFLLRFKPAHARVLPSKDASYEHVRGAVAAAQKAGTHLGLVGNARP